MYMLFCATTVVNKDEYKILLKTDVRRKFVPGDRIGMSGHNNNTVTIVTLLSYTAQPYARVHSGPLECIFIISFLSQGTEGSV